MCALLAKAVLHVPSVRKTLMLSSFACVTTESWFCICPLFFWTVWRGVFASTPSAAHTEARERVRFNRAATRQSACVIPEPHCAPWEGMCRIIRADQSRDPRARNVVADSACRLHMRCASETAQRARPWAQHVCRRGRLYSVRRALHICKLGTARLKRTHRTTFT